MLPVVLCELIERFVGESWYVHCPAWLTVKVLPATEIVPLRGAEVAVLGVTVWPAVPSPLRGEVAVLGATV